MPITAALFDFDGTLADSFAAITSSTNYVRASYNLPPMAEAAVRAYVGYGLDNLMADLVPGAPVEEAVGRYREHHATVMFTQTHLMPGAIEAIPELARRGYKLAVCSNKRVEFTRQLVRSLGLDAYFTCVLGPDDVGGRAKPEPDMLLEGLSRLKVSAKDAVYVGDMVVDVQTARAAGVEIWIVSNDGMGTFVPVAGDPHPDRVLASLSDLPGLLPAISQ